mmetsp:Transcript_8541/g.18462  ORF Transcript_8541/g.18462 Transcript_8541/m.18462 type:complete len:339 (-) Transcript_8541:70-1086(-)
MVPSRIRHHRRHNNNDSSKRRSKRNGPNRTTTTTRAGAIPKLPGFDNNNNNNNTTHNPTTTNQLIPQTNQSIIMSNHHILYDLLSGPILDVPDVLPTATEANLLTDCDESSHRCYDGNNSDQSLFFDTTTTTTTAAIGSPAMEQTTPHVVVSEEMTPDQQLYQQQLLRAQREFFLSATQAPTQQQNNKQSFTASWGEWDVPLGRCQEVREHVGNVRFRSLVDEHRDAYLKAGRRSEKSFISSKVYSIIKENGGRFLDKSSGKSGEWMEINEDKALAKISQALRTGTRPVRKQSAGAIQASKKNAPSTTPASTFSDDDLAAGASQMPTFGRTVTSESVC